MGNCILANNESEKDVGFIVDSQLNMNSQCNIVVKKANTILGCIRKGISNRSREVVLLLYMVLVRPLLILCPVLVFILQRGSRKI